MSISTDPTTNGAVEFGYETKNLDKLHQARGMKVFSFEDLDFSNFSFDSAFAHSYTKKVLVRNFNYIMFKIKSDNDKNCIINNLTIVYKINKIYSFNWTAQQFRSRIKTIAYCKIYNFKTDIASRKMQFL